MGRCKGTGNKQVAMLSPHSLLEPEERVSLLASIIVDGILEDQRDGSRVLKRLEAQRYARRIAG